MRSNKGFFVSCVLAALLPALTVSALDIQLTFDASNSLPEDFPSFDPDASLLGGIVQYVAGVYEDIIEDDHVLQLTYRWDRDLAETNMALNIRTGLHTLLGQSGGRETSARLRFDPDPAWFIDPTPTDDSEFDMAPVLYEGLTSLQQSNRFVGNVPGTFEAGFRGAAFSSAPATAQNNFDLLTIVFHEMGHALGMSGSLNTTLTETADGDYDVRPSLVGGNVMAERVRNMNSNNSRAHLFGGSSGILPGPAVMSTIGNGERRRPSAADIFAMSGPSNWLDIDLRRIQLLSGSALWHNDGSWLGGKMPNGNDAVWVSTGEAALMSDDAIVGELTVDNGSTLFTTGHLLWAIDQATVGGDGDGEIIIGGLFGPVDGGNFQGSNLAINPNGTVRLSGGNTPGNEATVNITNIALAGTIATNQNTWGIVNATTDVVSDATVSVATGGRLTFNNQIRGAGDFTKMGPGLLVLRSENPFLLGDMIVGEGTVEFDSANAVSSFSTLMVHVGATADFGSRADTFGGLAGGGTVFISQNMRIGANDRSTLFTGTIPQSAQGGLEKLGFGTMMFGTGADVTLDRLTLRDGGTIAVDGGAVQSEHLLLEAGIGIFGMILESTVRLQNGELITTNAYLLPDNNLQVLGGSFRGGLVTVDDALFQASGGTVQAEQIDLLNGGQFETTGGRLQVGTFNGDLINQGGTLAPGSPTGSTTINGDLTQQTAATFEIEIGGLAAVTQHDFVSISGDAMLDGLLEVSLIDGFVPAFGNTFQVLTATQVIGEFDRVETIDEDDLLGFVLSDIYSPTDVVLRVDDAFLIGDYNEDEVVDAADYTMWRDLLGAPAGSLPNDIDGGPIGMAQYETWKSHFGNTLPKPGAVATGQVPEPATWLLLLALLVATSFIRSASRQTP